MRKIFKLIFRLDFNLSYDLMDQPGQVLKAMMQDFPEDYWETLGEAAANRSLKAIRNKKNEYVEFTVEPNVISGVLEFSEGIEYSEMAENRSFYALSKSVEGICEKFKISELNRLGLRTFCFEQYAQGPQNQLSEFLKMLSPSFMTSFNENVGDVDDIGITFEGKTSEDLFYRVNFGSYEKKDPAKFMQARVSDVTENTENYHTTMDLDIWQVKFAMKGVSIKRWARDRWSIGDAVMNNIKALVVPDSNAAARG